MAYTTPWQAAGNTMIGRGKYGGNPVDFVNGNVDDVRMWSGALTASQVAGLDQAAHWTFDEGTGTTAHDVTGNGHDGTLGSSASWAPGTVGPHSVALNGTAAGNVTVPGPVVDTSGSFSVSAWVNVTSLKGRQTAVSIDGNQVSGFSARPPPTPSPTRRRWCHQQARSPGSGRRSSGPSRPTR